MGAESQLHGIRARGCQVTSLFQASVCSSVKWRARGPAGHLGRGDPAVQLQYLLHRTCSSPSSHFINFSERVMTPGGDVIGLELPCRKF